MDGSKTVTRRLGWQTLTAGVRLHACRQTQGLKRGQRVERLAVIEVVDVSRERLDAMLAEPYGSTEARREGFPHLDGAGFVAMFCEHMRIAPSDLVTRIAFFRPDITETHA
ncbi:MAG: ASCH domain-containing protein [Myxococcota bacterium]